MILDDLFKYIAGRICLRNHFFSGKDRGVDNSLLCKQCGLVVKRDGRGVAFKAGLWKQRDKWTCPNKEQGK